MRPLWSPGLRRPRNPREMNSSLMSSPSVLVSLCSCYVPFYHMQTFVNVTAVSSTQRSSIDARAKAHGRSPHCRSHDQMQIASVKAVRDAPVGLVQHRGLSLHRPLTRKGPLIESQSLRDSIQVTLVQDCSTGIRKVLGARVSDIGFRRPEAAPIGGSFSTLGIDRDRSEEHTSELQSRENLVCRL